MGLIEVNSIAEGASTAKTSPYRFWGRGDSRKQTPHFPSRERHFAIRRKSSADVSATMSNGEKLMFNQH